MGSEVVLVKLSIRMKNQFKSSYHIYLDNSKELWCREVQTFRPLSKLLTQ